MTLASAEHNVLLLPVVTKELPSLIHSCLLHHTSLLPLKEDEVGTALLPLADDNPSLHGMECVEGLPGNRQPLPDLRLYTPLREAVASFGFLPVSDEILSMH